MGGYHGLLDAPGHRFRRSHPGVLMSYRLLTFGAWLVYLMPAQAFALVLQPVQPALCTSGLWTYVSWQYCTNEWCGDDASVTPPNGDGYVAVAALPTPQYQNNIRNNRTFWANAYVRQAQFQVESFSLATGDSLQLYQDTGPTTAHTGTKSAGTWLSVSTSQNLNRYPISQRFIADGSARGSGFSLENVRVCGNSTIDQPAPAVVVSETIRNSGILLAQGDVVYFQLADYPLGYKTNLVLWGAGNDIDMKVRCDAFPTMGTFNLSSTSSDNNEFLQFDRLGCVSGWMYVAVYLYGTGTAYFNLVASRMNPTMNKYLKIGFRDNVSAATLDQSLVPLRESARRYYGITEGQHVIRTLDVYRNTGSGCTNCGGSQCDVCIWAGATNKAFPPCFGLSGPITLDLNAALNSPETLAHEWSHQYLCIKDEYELYLGNNPPTECIFCGHSVIAINLMSDSNLCVNSPVFADHHLDTKYTGNVTICQNEWNANPRNGSWQDLPGAASVIHRPNYTPDPFTYKDHDFNSNIAVFGH